MKLTIIGCTGSMSGPESSASCYLLQANGFDPDLGEERTWSIALDIGPGSFGQLWRHIDPRELDAVFISHGHPDHMADIMSLQVFLKWHPEGPANAVSVFGPGEIRRRVAQIEGYVEESVVAEFFDFVTATDGETFVVGPFKATAYPGNHTVESYGFRVEGPSSVNPEKTVTFAYTGDTDSCESMVAMADAADLLLCECGFTNDSEARGVHLSGTRAGELARDSRAKTTVLTHIQPWTNPAVPVGEFAEVMGVAPEVATPGATWII